MDDISFDLRMQELAPDTVGAVQVFVELFTHLGLVVIRHMLLLLEFMLSMRK